MTAVIKIKKRKIELLFIEQTLMVVIAVFLSYDSILPKSSRIVTIALLFLTGIHIFYMLYTKEFDNIQVYSPLIFWFAFYFFVIIDRGPIGFSENHFSWPGRLFCIFLYLLFNSRNNNKILYFFIKTLAYVELGNAAATVFFWLFPNVYPLYRTVFLSNIIRIVGAGFKSGLTSHYSTNGLLLSLGLFASYALLLTKEKKYKFFIILYLFALTLTTKRAHLVFSLISCLFIFWLSNRKKGFNKWIKYAFILIFLAFIWYIIAQFIPDLGITFVRLENTNDFAREAYRDICIQIFHENPLIGKGWGAFTTDLYGTYLGSELIALGNTRQDAHNVYYQILAEQGLIGEILFITAIITTLLFSVKRLDYFVSLTFKGIYNNEVLTCISFSIIIQVFIILYNLTGNPLYSYNCYIPYFFSMGILVNYNGNFKNA